MSSLLLRIVLTVLLVLSLLLLLIRAYVEYKTSRTAVKALHPSVAATTSSSATETNDTSVSRIQALFHESNTTLDQKYKNVASEIMDFIHAREMKKEEQNQSRAAAKKFVSRCRQPVGEITLPKPSLKPEPKKVPHKVLKPHKPYLVIIMDDIRSVEEGEMIRQLPFPVTPSIFPVTSDHPDTQEIARMFHTFMIHMPMEAYHFSSPEENTLFTGDSLRTIKQRIADIKADFPRLTAINNHTGSKFTSDLEAMDKLFCALGEFGIPFVDSRTSAATKAREMAKLFHRKVLERNVFLDNEDSIPSVLNQLKEAVAYAKAHKQAIAICHPKPTTFEALKQAKPLLKGVEVVTIDKLY